jgi:UDP-N-acetyl-D-mannosaminuronic acid transferase (WecB/TagA/CpsF family)
MPLSDWSTTGGDLRIPHFFGMHALQLLPLLVMVLAALAPCYARLADERVRTRLVLLASGVYAAVFALLLRQALRGQPLIHPDGMTLAAALAILVVAVLTRCHVIEWFSDSA